MCSAGLGKDREALAILGGFQRVDPSVAHGAPHAAWLASLACVKRGGFGRVDSFQDLNTVGLRASAVVELPGGGSITVRPKRELVSSVGEFEAVLSLETEWDLGVPHAFRPLTDWTPVVCEVGTSHSPTQWLYLFSALACGYARPHDVLLFKGDATRRLFAAVTDEWKERFGIQRQCEMLVIPQAVDSRRHHRNEDLRRDVRARVGIADSAVLFLAFSRLSPGTKGDQLALLTLWKRAMGHEANAFLILAGATVDRHFTEDLRRLARQLHIGGSVAVLDDPHSIWPDPGCALMSAADVFVHLSTGPEEVASLVACEAMAYGLPVIGADWSGMSGIVQDGLTGVLVPTYAVAVPSELRQTLSFGREPSYNAELSRCVVIDTEKVVESLCDLLQHADRRRAMGSAARSRAENVLDVNVVSQVRLDVLKHAAQEARSHWDNSQGRAVRSLVDANAIVAALASDAGLEARTVTVGLVDNVRFLPEWSVPGIRPLCDTVIEVANALGPASVADLVKNVTSCFEDDGTTDSCAPDALAGGLTRLCARLIAFGVLRFKTAMEH